MEQHTAVYAVFKPADLRALAYLYSLASVTGRADLERAIVTFRQDLEHQYPGLNAWRLYSRVVSFGDVDLLLRRVREYNRDAVRRYHYLVNGDLLTNLDIAIDRGDLEAIGDEAFRLAETMLA